MTRILKAFSRAGKVSRFIGATLVTAAGTLYLVFPPNTTAAFFEGDWPAQAWGFIMLIAGGVIIWGIRSRILQVEQYGMLMMAVATGLLSVAQTLVMGFPEFTPTRGGGTLILWAIVAFAVARYFELSADIRSARLAGQKVEGS